MELGAWDSVAWRLLAQRVALQDGVLCPFRMEDAFEEMKGVEFASIRMQPSLFEDGLQ